jgi:hypothetical protein
VRIVHPRKIEFLGVILIACAGEWWKWRVFERKDIQITGGLAAEEDQDNEVEIGTDSDTDEEEDEVEPDPLLLGPAHDISDDVKTSFEPFCNNVEDAWPVARWS